MIDTKIDAPYLSKDTAAIYHRISHNPLLINHVLEVRTNLYMWQRIPSNLHRLSGAFERDTKTLNKMHEQQYFLQ